MRIASPTIEEVLEYISPKLLEKKRESMKAYYEANKDKIAERGKAYYEANKDKIAERGKAYYEANKDKLKAYREANKDKIAERNKARDEEHKRLTYSQRLERIAKKYAGGVA